MDVRKEREIMNLDFGKYYEAPEPGRRERAYAWATAIGLQDVDGLRPSQYLIFLAKENIEGRITAEEVIKRIDEHYEKRKIRQEYGTTTAKAIADLHRHDDVVKRRDDGINDGINKPNDVINRGDDVVKDVQKRQDDVVNDAVKFTEKEEIAVKALIRDPRLSAARLADLIGVKQRQAQRIITSLKNKAGLKRRGADKNGEWYFEGAAK